MDCALDELGREDDDASKIVPNFENEFVRAKTFLQTASTVTGENLYDHLSDVLNKILAERPDNVIDFFEEYSRKVKEKRFHPLTDHFEDIFVRPRRYRFSKKLHPLLMPLEPDEPSTMDPEDMDIAEMTNNNLLQLMYYFEQAGIGLPRLEMFAIMLSMSHFIKREPVKGVRFWGKIFGDFRHYLVLEADLKEDEIIRLGKDNLMAVESPTSGTEESVISQKANEGEDKLENLENDSGERSDKRQLPPMPKRIVEEPVVIPAEPLGTGVNRKVYYVCNEVGDDWVMLPTITPQQVQVARIIKKSFTGILNEALLTYPEFPGKEAHYLHAQICRISAATHISPLGYYTFEEEAGEESEEEEEEGEEEENERLKYKQTAFIENRHFEGLHLRDLIDPSLAFWVHHSTYILPQGRTTWWSPDSANDQKGREELGEGEDDEEEYDDDDEEEDRDEEAERKVRKTKSGLEPETGPPLLTSLSEDASLDTVNPWSIRASSMLQSNFAIAIVRSNIWPGAFCFATQGKLFANIYLGDGLKYSAQNVSPKSLPPIQQEYVLGPEIMEIDDPSGHEEEAWKIAHLPREKQSVEDKIEEEDESDEDEEEEEEEEDDDDEDE